MRQMQSNKANSLGQSKALFRSVLPSGDLQRYHVSTLNLQF